jgi:phosphonate metabolism protein (transferase hexapeptide repeat family)
MKLSEKPSIHPTALVVDSTVGKYTEVGARCHVAHSTMGDYSYCVENTQIAYAKIGKFSNIAAHVRIYASRHPMDRASLHHFTYRSAWYFDGTEDDQSFFEWRASMPISIGHDTWIGHGPILMPGVAVGNGSVIGSGAVVTRDVPAHAVAVGSPAR